MGVFNGKEPILCMDNVGNVNKHMNQGCCAKSIHSEIARAIKKDQ
jgi:hypothetical protein